MREATSKPPPIPNLFINLTDLGNLHRYWYRVRHSRSLRPRFVRFNEHLLEHLTTIQARLRQGDFEFGPYQFFFIREKKMRSIANAPLKDRIVHWMLYEYLLERWMPRFIHDTYGNLPGRGTHAAVHRLADWMRKPSLQYALQLDIAKYFSSIQHDYLKRILLSREGDQHIRHLLIGLIESYRTGAEFDHLFADDSPYRITFDKGMPLGNLTSQLFANIYLNEFDHWVKETLRVPRYIRYVDDIAILGYSAQDLKPLRDHIINKLETFGLTINPKKVAIRQTQHGIPFLGYIVWPSHISAGKYARNRYAKTLRNSNAGIANSTSLAAYHGIFSHTGSTYR